MKRHILKIRPDPMPYNPREDLGYPDRFGTIYYSKYSREGYGDEAIDPDTLEIDDGSIVLPVFAYVHSGVSLSLGSHSVSCPFDSGQCGVFVFTPDDAKHFGFDIKADRDRIVESMRTSLAEYNAWINGDVWCADVIEVSTCDHGCEHEQHVDGCSGFAFLGDDSEIVEWIADSIGIDRETVAEAWDDRFYGYAEIKDQNESEAA